MAKIKIAYIGGGSTRAPGTMASFIAQGENFDGSEIVLIDLDKERLALVKTLAEKMAREAGVNYTITTTTNRREGLKGCDAVLSSFRPGGFEARYLDEIIPLKHGIIGQETQGPGGFFMALRSIHVMKGIIRDMEKVCPNAILFNYTNPVNIVAEAVSHHTKIKVVSLCEGPIIFTDYFAWRIGLDPAKLQTSMVGLNHGSWTVRHTYDGQDFMPMVKAGYEKMVAEGSDDVHGLRLFKLAATMGSLPAHYFNYYYYKEDILAELQAKPTTRAQDIMAEVPDYWKHYREQAFSTEPSQLDPRRSRGGINELELAIDVMDAIFNDRKEVWPVNVPNHGAIADLPDDLVVEVPGYCDKNGIFPVAQGNMPKQVVGLVKMLAEYQALTAEAAWSGTRIDAIRALASNPLVFSIEKAEALYDEMAAAQKKWLPKRLLK